MKLGTHSATKIRLFGTHRSAYLEQLVMCVLCVLCVGVYFLGTVSAQCVDEHFASPKQGAAQRA
jgi:hypothetical protein